MRVRITNEQYYGFLAEWDGQWTEPEDKSIESGAWVTLDVDGRHIILHRGEFEIYHEDNATRFERILDEMNTTYNKKNADYGDSFSKSCDKFGIIAAVVRMEDKMNRLENLTTSNEPAKVQESVRDTLMDLANYAAMTAMWLDNDKNKKDSK